MSGYQGPGGQPRGALARARSRAARATAMRESKDQEVAEIANRVYGIGVELKRERSPLTFPLSIQAPFTAAAELIALAVIRREGLDETPENISAAASYFLLVQQQAVVEFDASTLAHFLESAGAAAAGGEPT